MKILLAATAFAAAFSTFALAPAVADDYDTGLIPSPKILLPQSAPKAAVVLISDSDGWGAADDGAAATLVGAGDVVIGIDLPSYLKSIEADDGDCTYLVSDIESLSQQTQREVGGSAYHLPVVAGRGAGGTLALQIAAQTPAATIGATVAVDPDVVLPLSKELCTDAAHEKTPAGWVYQLSDEDLPDPVTVAFTPAGAPDARAHVDALKSAHPAIAIEAATEAPDAALLRLVEREAAASQATNASFDLPITELDATPTRDTMAVIISGDGGWRDLDKEVGGYLQGEGVPVIGVDSLRYFWSERTPEQTAADLSRIIETYRKRWHVRHVLLAGYSFGADVLPAVYAELNPAIRQRVVQLSLMALSETADWEVSVSGWLGVDTGGTPTLPPLGKIDPKLVQCVYGTEEDDSACPALKGKAEVIAIEGGHHFDEDYDALGAKVLSGLDRRLSAAPGKVATE
ncbi:virulence factor family protein [Mangrovibrevibacter kandeliae]|uniref:virulence factor family protein n=1 Tax=Mangrovibrevibacter kandeliae TaxID=2968473 RepID=UPI00211990B0|nr:AcvB/VirJ family lysyl-phosphatidylglycerol hydrolase [Aurantimonas sp. CSK15Z-1]MCQ8783224.1 virulence factor family protein [Aurantimonas sp. CSK15Z-1]